MYKTIEPEVAGGLGDDTKLDTATNPPVVQTLHYEFFGWLGGDILETYPCFIVTDGLKAGIVSAGLSGVAFDVVKITTSPLFNELYPGLFLPAFNWMKVFGKAGADDFGVNDKRLLTVSDAAFEVLSSFNLSDAEIGEYEL